MSEWIPCTERLPEPGKVVLVTYAVMGRDRTWDTAWIDDDGEWWVSCSAYIPWRDLWGDDTPILAWMDVQPWKEAT